jgi:hypothetical protein
MLVAVVVLTVPAGAVPGPATNEAVGPQAPHAEALHADTLNATVCPVAAVRLTVSTSAVVPVYSTGCATPLIFDPIAYSEMPVGLETVQLSV